MLDARKYELAKLYEKLSELTASYQKAIETDQAYEMRKNMRTQMRRFVKEIDKLKEELRDNSPDDQAS